LQQIRTQKMAVKYRIILDVKNDVIRDIVMANSSNLEDLHFLIAKAFGFNGQEMASFYKSNLDWDQGEEIPLFDMSEDGVDNSMKTYSLYDATPTVGDKLIYVYDFMKMWTFFVEVTEQDEDKASCTKPVTFAFGDAPEQAPEKKFESEIVLGDEFDEDIFNNPDNFDNIDDLDLDNY